MNKKDFTWVEKRFGTRFATILKKLGGLSKDGTDGSIEYKDEQGNVTKLVTDSNFGSLLAKNGLIEVKWQELKDKRDNGQLIPGSLYRITDYNCTTTQENTRSAGHQFDIVLLALSENKLAEEGWAMMHDNIYDVTFVDGVTKKCYLYRFYSQAEEDYTYNVVYVETLLGVSEVMPDLIDEINKTATFNSDSGMPSTNMMDVNIPYNYFQNSNLSAWKVWYCLDNDTARFAWADNVNGKGVIYRLIDELNNDCPYDFKNIQFYTPILDGHYDRDNGENEWTYTLNAYDIIANFCYDASIICLTIEFDGDRMSCCNNFINPNGGQMLRVNYSQIFTVIDTDEEIFTSIDNNKIYSSSTRINSSYNNLTIGSPTTISYGGNSIYINGKKVLTEE